MRSSRGKSEGGFAVEVSVMDVVAAVDSVQAYVCLCVGVYLT